DILSAGFGKAELCRHGVVISAAKIAGRVVSPTGPAPTSCATGTIIGPRPDFSVPDGGGAPAHAPPSPTIEKGNRRQPMTQARWLPVLALALGLAGCAHKHEAVPCDRCGPNGLPPGGPPPGARIVPAPPPGATVLPGNPAPGGFVPGGADTTQPFNPNATPFNPSSGRPPVVQGQVRLPGDLFAPRRVHQAPLRPDSGPPHARLRPPHP